MDSLSLKLSASQHPEFALNFFRNVFQASLGHLWAGLLRMMRAFRVFRLFKRVESLRKIMTSLGKAVPGVANAFFIQAKKGQRVLLMNVFRWSAMGNCYPSSHLYFQWKKVVSPIGSFPFIWERFSTEPWLWGKGYFIGHGICLNLLLGNFLHDTGGRVWNTMVGQHCR